MSAAQRRKGKVWERDVARAFREALPGTDPHRGQQCRDGSDASDVEGVPGFWIEAKHRAAISPEAALRQAQAACKDATRTPIAVVKRNRSAAFVCIDFDDFLRLVQRSQGIVEPAAVATPDGRQRVSNAGL